MNERIRECWLKAAREDSDDKWDTQEQFIERFAELIVQECMSLCQECIDDGCIEAEEPMRKIEKHFGVES